MRQTAADGAAVAYLDMADECRCIAQQRPTLGNLRRTFKLALAGRCTDAQRGIVRS